MGSRRQGGRGANARGGGCIRGVACLRKSQNSQEVPGTTWGVDQEGETGGLRVEVEGEEKLVYNAVRRGGGGTYSDGMMKGGGGGGKMQRKLGRLVKKSR